MLSMMEMMRLIMKTRTLKMDEADDDVVMTTW